MCADAATGRFKGLEMRPAVWVTVTCQVRVPVSLCPAAVTDAAATGRVPRPLCIVVLASCESVTTSNPRVLREKIAQPVRAVKLSRVILSREIPVIMHLSRPIGRTTAAANPTANHGLELLVTEQRWLFQENRWHRYPLMARQQRDLGGGDEERPLFILYPSILFPFFIEDNFAALHVQ